MHKISIFEITHYRDRYTKQINKLIETLEGRLLPALSNIDEEVDRTLSELERGAPDGTDLLMIQEAALNASYEHFDLMSDVEQALINMFGAALYHLFEQQLRMFHVRVLYEKPLEYAPQILTAWNDGLGISMPDEQSEGIKELRLLANTIKHGDGDSAKSLFKMNPRLFRDIWEKDVDDDPSIKVHKPEVYTPMFGQGIYIEMDDIRRYQKNVLETWSTYFDQFSRVG